MKPPDDFNIRVTARVEELLAKKLDHKINVRDVFFGEDPNATWDDRVEAVAQAIADIERNPGRKSEPPISKVKPMNVSDWLAQRAAADLGEEERKG